MHALDTPWPIRILSRDLMQVTKLAKVYGMYICKLQKIQIALHKLQSFIFNLSNTAKHFCQCRKQDSTQLPKGHFSLITKLGFFKVYYIHDAQYSISCFRQDFPDFKHAAKEANPAILRLCKQKLKQFVKIKKS